MFWKYFISDVKSGKKIWPNEMFMNEPTVFLIEEMCHSLMIDNNPPGSLVMLEARMEMIWGTGKKCGTRKPMPYRRIW